MPIASTRKAASLQPDPVRHYRFRRMVSAIWWLIVPSALLLPARASDLAPLFCGTNPNMSYDAMLIGASLGLAIANLRLSRAARLAGDGRPVQPLAPTALDVFEICALASIGLFYAVAGIYVSALVWAAGCLLCFTLLVGQIEAQAGQAKRAPTRSPATILASVLLILIALVFLGFPVSRAWDGPVQAFVRWHPYDVDLERVWRGIFFSYAIGMLVAARDPAGRHLDFMVALGWSGVIHGLVMAADNLISHATGTINGNLEHLYGDVLGWTLIGATSLVFALRHRPPSAKPGVPGPQSQAAVS